MNSIFNVHKLVLAVLSFVVVVTGVITSDFGGKNVAHADVGRYVIKDV